MKQFFGRKQSKERLPTLNEILKNDIKVDFMWFGKKHLINVPARKFLARIMQIPLFNYKGSEKDEYISRVDLSGGEYSFAILKSFLDIYEETRNDEFNQDINPISDLGGHRIEKITLKDFVMECAELQIEALGEKLKQKRLQSDKEQLNTIKPKIKEKES